MPTMVRDSVEYLKFTLTDRDGANITADTVQVALRADGDTSALTWVGCTFVSGSTWRTTTAITWSTANYPGTYYFVYAKLSDSPEVPQAKIGTVSITT